MFIVLMLLGIISQCPHYVLSEGDFFTSEQIQEVWISGFQLVGIAGVGIIFYYYLSFLHSIQSPKACLSHQLQHCRHPQYYPLL